MIKRSISEELATTFARIGELAEQNRAGEASEQALERTAYLEREVDLLCRDLRSLQRACSTLARYASHSDALEVWTATCRELSATLPAGVSSLSQLLASADLELLRISAYIGAARAKVTERARQPMAELGAFIKSLDHVSNVPLRNAFDAVERLDGLSDLAAIGAAWDALDAQIAAIRSER
jgi:hypothetical protein